MKQLYAEYLETYDIIKQTIKKNRQKINDLIRNEDIVSNPELRKKLDDLKVDHSKLFSMLIDLEYVIEWLETGHEPKEWEGIPNLRVGVRDDANR